MILERDEDGFFERVVTIHPLTRAVQTIDLNATHRVYELGASLAPWRLWSAAKHCVRIAREERVDLVRATDAYLMGLIAWWVARARRIPFCVSVHADYAKRFALAPARGMQAWLRRVGTSVSPFVLRRADMVLPIRESLVPSLVAAGARPSRVRVIPHGIDLSLFKTAPAVEDEFKAGSRKIISFVGRLTADNYASDIAAVIARVAARRNDVAFVLMGEGPGAAPIRELAEQFPQSVHLLPFQPRQRVASLRFQSAASLCLMAGFSLIEACAAGSPPIAYDVEWHRELVRDRETGMLVREHDLDGVERAIDWLLDHPAEARAIGARARELAFARHDLTATSRLKRECYSTLLNGGAA